MCINLPALLLILKGMAERRGISAHPFVLSVYSSVASLLSREVAQDYRSTSSSLRFLPCSAILTC